MTAPSATAVSYAGSVALGPVLVPQEQPTTPVDDVPRAIGKATLDDKLSLLGAGVGSLALVWLVYYGLLPFSGLVGFVVCWLLAFIAMYAGVVAISNPLPVVKDRVMGSIMYISATVVAAALTWTLVYTLAKGWQAYTHWNFFTKTMSGVATDAPLNQGGIKHAIVGSAIILGIAIVISLPLGLGTAIYLTEVRSRLATLVRTVVEAMTAVPDLLAGLFVYVVLIIGFGGHHMEKNGLAAAIALSVTMTPIIARSAEVAIRVVPGGLREGGAALGASQWQTVWRIVLPTARPGLATALILAMARGAGETAPLLIVSGATSFMNHDPLHQPMTSLPLFIFLGARSGENLYIARAFGAASVLLIIVLILFVITRLLARQRVGRR